MPPTTAEIKARFRPNVINDLRNRAARVQALARLNLSGAGGRPRRVNTGRLRSSVEIRQTRRGIFPAYQIGTTVRYASWVHDGIGLFGPRRRLITARRRGGVMRFKAKSGDIVYTRYVRGYPRNQFLKDALRAAGEG